MAVVPFYVVNVREKRWREEEKALFCKKIPQRIV
jgi:hypothetical protein